MKEMYQQGYTKKEIAKQFSCCVPTVTKYIGKTQQSIDMINQSFGRLTVLSLADKKENRKSRVLYYVCQCSCGNIVEVSGAALRSGHTQSCGCYHTERTIISNKKDLSGQKYGKLTPLYTVGVSLDRHYIWHCQCDCGNFCDVNSHYLTTGSVKSCGCLKSFKELEIENLLKKYNINYKKEYSFLDLYSDKNRPLRFDFAIFNQENQVFALIEYQGEQHYDPTNRWHTLSLQQHDQLKRQYCKKKQYRLYLLDKNTNLENFIKQLKDEIN